MSAQQAISPPPSGFAIEATRPRSPASPRSVPVGRAGPATGSPAPEAPGLPLRAQRLSTLLAATAQVDPHRIALVDPLGKPGWSGRPAIVWTYGTAAEIVARLADGLHGWRLPAESRIGLAAQDGVEGALAFLAVEAAGHIPVLLPALFDEDDLVTAVQAAGISAVLTQSRFGQARPAERMCRVAARYFGLRYLGAFGPGVPDGVIKLDAMVVEQRRRNPAPGPGGVVTFAGGDPARPMHRSSEALAAAIAAHCVSARMSPGDRLLTLLPGSDLRGLVTGLGAALMAGVAFEPLPVFDAVRFAEALARPVTTHLVVPAALEANLAASRLPATLASIVLAHRAPSRLPPHRLPSRAGCATVIDVIAFEETALLTGARPDGDVALALAAPERVNPLSTLMNLRRDPEGALAFRGRACHAGALQRGIPQPEFSDEWLSSPFRSLVEGDRATEVVRA